MAALETDHYKVKVKVKDLIEELLVAFNFDGIKQVVDAGDPPR